MVTKWNFQIYFHSPADVPDYSHDSIKFSKNTHSLVQITTHLTLTDDSIKHWSPEERGCYYSNEKWLKYNKIYSYINCYVECQVNSTESLCGCVPIFRLSKHVEHTVNYDSIKIIFQRYIVVMSHNGITYMVQKSHLHNTSASFQYRVFADLSIYFGFILYYCCM